MREKKENAQPPNAGKRPLDECPEGGHSTETTDANVFLYTVPGVCEEAHREEERDGQQEEEKKRPDVC
jgi:hypothetical protein